MRQDPAPLDTDALAAIADPGDWLFAFIHQAIERDVIRPQQVVDLQAMAEQFDDVTLANVRQAFEHGYPADGLPEREAALFFELLGVRERVPSAAARVTAAEVCKTGGAVGYDAQDRLVWSLPGGAIDVVLDADGKPVGAVQ